MSTAYRTRRRRTPAERSAIEGEALSRARCGMSAANYETIIREFMARGIPAADIIPRVNVLTYHAWRAVGRQVRRGEHGVSVLSFIPLEKSEERKTEEATGKKRRRNSLAVTATVFHISQTDEIDQSPKLEGFDA